MRFIVTSLSPAPRFRYPTNLISRFYAAPYIGARLQQALVEHDFRGEVSDFKKTVSYESTLGKTQGALAPHEFLFFWGRFFTLGQDAHVVSPENLAKVDSAKFVRELASLEAALEKPLALKGMYLNWHIPFLDGLFEWALFVHLKREPAYVVQSLLESRQKFFGSEEMWYSVKPPEYAWLKDRDPVAQVAGQVYFTRKATETGMAQLAEARSLTLEYERFCAAPAEAWEAIRARLAAQGHALEAGYKGPARFETGNTVRVPAERWKAIQEACLEFQRNE